MRDLNFLQEKSTCSVRPGAKSPGCWMVSVVDSMLCDKFEMNTLIRANNFLLKYANLEYLYLAAVNPDRQNVTTGRSKPVGHKGA